MPLKSVAIFLGVGWDLVKDSHKEYLEKCFKKRKLRNVKYIGVDEFSIKKKHHYMTIVVDLQTGEVIFAHEGKDANAFIPFLKKLKCSKAKVKGIAMDMSPAYIKAVKEIYGDTVAIIHDRYHVTALANKAIDDTRRELARELEDEGRKVLKGSRFLLLTGSENLDEEHESRLMELLKLNQPLYHAYLLKEDLRVFWEMPDKERASTFLFNWMEQAKQKGGQFFEALAETLKGHLDGLLSYFAHPISTGPLEGLNNKIKVLKRQAYGFRDMAYFKLRLYFLHESQIELIAR